MSCDKLSERFSPDSYEPKNGAIKMINHISIVGVHEPEKLAEGLCPHCQAMVDLWMTGQGLELASHGEDYKLNINEENDRTLLGFTKNLLLKNIPIPVSYKRTVFYALLTFASMALLIQALYYFWPPIWEPRIIPLDIHWLATMQTLLLILLGLTAVNFLTYKFRSSDSGPNQIDRWTLASSIIIVDYYLLSRIALPLLLIYKLNLPLW